VKTVVQRGDNDRNNNLIFINIMRLHVFITHRKQDISPTGYRLRVMSKEMEREVSFSSHYCLIY